MLREIGDSLKGKVGQVKENWGRIQKSKQPQWNLVFKADFDVIGHDESIFLSLYLLVCFIVTAHFKKPSFPLITSAPG